MVFAQYRRNPEVDAKFPKFYPFLDEVIEGYANQVAAAVQLADARPPNAPRRLWLYWGQGWQQAPDLCRLCRESWEARNTQYRIEAIDQESMPDLLDGVDLDRQIYSPRIRANVLRLRLLLRHGGVWADPTIFCARGLHEWLPFCSADSSLFLFAFRLGGDRRIANWFIKGDGSSRLLAAWSALYESYLQALIASRTGIHAYFAQHYIFDVVRQIIPEAAEDWERMPKLPPAAAGGALGVILDPPRAPEPDAARAVSAAGLSEQEQRRIARLLAEIPIHKLSWKGEARRASIRSTAFLAELRRSVPARPGA